MGRAAAIPSLHWSTRKDGAIVRKLVALLVVAGLFAVGCNPSTPTGTKPQTTTPKTTTPTTPPSKTDSNMPKTDTPTAHPKDENKDDKKP